MLKFVDKVKDNECYKDNFSINGYHRYRKNKHTQFQTIMQQRSFICDYFVESTAINTSNDGYKYNIIIELYIIIYNPYVYI